MTIKTAPELPRALLVSIKTPKITDKETEESLAELERLVTTLGFRVIEKQIQRQPNTTGPSAVGAGKLEQLAYRTGAKVSTDKNETELANIVVFDCDLRPSQLRNIEGALGVEVFDRTGIIIEIFSRHAKTRAAKLQVEIARLNYLSPRLRETGSSGERQAGRGAGESGLELERRGVRDRLAQLKRELESAQDQQTSKRTERSDQMCAALVGYTNAGKSSTMRALTSSEVLVEDKLFATLDTTVRALKPETMPRILISDTVGFIKKLPHDLVASFRSTLDEANNASLLLYVVDTADPNFRSQLETVDEALKDVGAANTSKLLIFNKIDLAEAAHVKRLKLEFPKAIFISAHIPSDIEKLREKIIDFFESQLITTEVFAPYTTEGIVGEIRSTMRVLKEKSDELGTHFTVKAKPEQLARLKKHYPI